MYVNKSVCEWIADTHSQINPPPRHNYPRLKFNVNPERERKREERNTDSDRLTEGGRLKRKKNIKTRENKKRKRIIKSMEERFHSHHSNRVLKTAIVAIMVCGTSTTRSQFVTENNMKAGKMTKVWQMKERERLFTVPTRTSPELYLNLHHRPHIPFHSFSHGGSALARGVPTMV